MIMLGKCPNWVLQKAKTIINNADAKHKVSKKLSCMKNYYSVKISTNYRVLWADSGDFFVGKHNHYDRKIKNIKRKGTC